MAGKKSEIATAKKPATKFVKGIFKPGTYFSPDGVLEVTPERLRGWAASHQKMSSAGYIVPSKWDHGKKRKDLTPLSQDVFKSAKNTVGRLAEFKVIGDGKNGAEITVEISNPEAAGQCERNEIEVSPVILSEFMAGATGEKFHDIIGHVDLVDYAVDRSQTKFTKVGGGEIATNAPSPGGNLVIACSSIRMSSKPSVFRLSSVDDEEDDDKGSGNAAPKDGDGDGKVNEGDSDTSDDTEGGDESTEGGDSDTDEASEDSEDGQPGDGDGGESQQEMKDVLDFLLLHDIDLGPDTTEENFMDRLKAALRTSAKKDGKELEAPDQNDGDGNGNAGTDNGSVIADPGYVAMSSMKAFADKAYSKDLTTRLDRVLKTGRCTPAEAKTKQKELGVVRLSLLSDGRARPNDFTLWLESREALRENSAFDATATANQSKLRLSSAPPGEFVPQPSIPEGDPSVATEQQQKQWALEILANR